MKPKSQHQSINDAASSVTFRTGLPRNQNVTIQPPTDGFQGCAVLVGGAAPPSQSRLKGSRGDYQSWYWLFLYLDKDAPSVQVMTPNASEIYVVDLGPGFGTSFEDIADAILFGAPKDGGEAPGDPTGAGNGHG